MWCLIFGVALLAPSVVNPHPTNGVEGVTQVPILRPLPESEAVTDSDLDPIIGNCVNSNSFQSSNVFGACRIAERNARAI